MMSPGKFVICAGLLFAISGCGIADHYVAQGRMDKAEDDYRKCLTENAAQPSRCDTLKALYEQDKADYQNN